MFNKGRRGDKKDAASTKSGFVSRLFGRKEQQHTVLTIDDSSEDEKPVAKRLRRQESNDSTPKKLTARIPKKGDTKKSPVNNNQKPASSDSTKTTSRETKRVQPVLLGMRDTKTTSRKFAPKREETPTKKRKRAPLAQVKSDPQAAEVARSSTPTQFSSDDVVTTYFLESHCWACKKRVKEVDGHASFYAMHVHPVLKVPSCRVCCDELEAMEIPDDQDDLEQCCACAEEPDDLLLCDMCPRGFCDICTAQAWGGGPEGVRRVQRLKRDDSRSWACIACIPPKPLTGLQIPDATSSSENEKDDDDDDTKAKEIVAKLDAIEDELDQYDCLMADDNVQRLEAEIATELSETIASTRELEEQVSEEISSWKEEHMAHIVRVNDSRVDLLERLNLHGISDDQYYKYRAERIPFKKEEEGDSEWIRDADAEIQRRELNERETRIQSKDDSSDDDSEVDEKEALAEVEDLCTSSQPEEWETEEILNNRKLWTGGIESKEWIEKKLNKYMARDDTNLENIGSRVTKVDVDTDEKAARKDFAFASSKSSGGVAIRRDTIQAMQVKTKHIETFSLSSRKKKKRERTESSSPHSSRSATTDRSQIGLKSTTTSNSRKNPAAQTSTASASPTKRNGVRGTRDVQNDPMDEATELRPFAGDVFWDSCVELCSEDEGENTRTVRLADAMASKLKPHQVDGIKFMWKNSCRDLSMITTQEEAAEERDVGGCILAHMMGLGKSLQVVALVHTLLHHPSLRPPDEEDANSFIQKILLIVPVNTIVNWTNEFEKWTGRLKHSVRYFDYSAVTKGNRPKIIQNWTEKGGVLLIGADAFTRLVKQEKGVSKHFHDPGPDMVIIDEAHTLLKSKNSEIAKVLGPLRTKRRITLSGTPFVNNLKEYFKLADWCRPGALGSAAQFDKKYVQQIMDGLASNSTTEQVAQQVRTSKKLFDATAPFVQRRGISFLTRDLPPCQTVVIYIRPSKLQSSLYRSFDKFARQLFGENKLSFIAHYQMLRPLHNHPYCLVQQARGKGDNRKGDEQGQKRLGNNGPLKVKAELCQDSKNVSYEKRIDDDGVIFLLDSDSDEGVPGSGRNSPVEDAVKDQATSVKELNAEAKPAAVSKRSLSKGRKQMEYPWMEKILAKIDESKLDSVKHGFKIFLLLQILAHAQSMGDKVVVFSQCLKTLDFIEKVLNTNDWARFCQGQEQNKKLGSWKKGVDYLRIDGSVNATERGQLVSDFHEELGGIKAFLLSIEAGGIGINLVAANRVVIFDNHWNPTVSSQAFHRCYRYGQEKPVFGYRFITQGSMEEKIFSRSMNKSGIAARVIDQQFPERNFTEREMAEIQAIDSWVQCDRCNKWRILFFVSEEDLPDKWYCKMNNDPLNKKCDVEERTGRWYESHRSLIMDKIAKKLDEKPVIGRESLDMENNDKADATKKELVKKDDVLVAMGLLDLFDKSKEEKNLSGGSPTSVISDIQFQEMLQIESADLEIEASHAEAEAAAAKEAEATSSSLSNDAEGMNQKPENQGTVSSNSSNAIHTETLDIAKNSVKSSANGRCETAKEPAHNKVDGKPPKGASASVCEAAPVKSEGSSEATRATKQSIDCLQPNESKPDVAMSDVTATKMRSPQGTDPTRTGRKVKRSPTTLPGPKSDGKSTNDAIELLDSDDE